MENEEQPAAAQAATEISKLERIQSHFTTANDHWNKYTFEIYNSVTKSGLWDDVEMPLDAFSYAVNLLWNGRNSPLSAVQALMDTFNEQNDPPFTDEHKRYILTQLIRYYRNTFFETPDKKEFRLDQIETILATERDKLSEPVKDEVRKFDWQATKDYVDTLPDINVRIAHLIEQVAAYKQAFGGWRIKGFGPDYDKQCQSEIKKLKELAALEQQGQATASPFKITEKKGAKTNLIRVLNALYELNLIELKDGQRATKEQFMQQIGGFIGINAESYFRDLEQALNQSLEANVKVFDELKKSITEQVLAKQNGSHE